MGVSLKLSILEFNLFRYGGVQNWLKGNHQHPSHPSSRSPYLRESRGQWGHPAFQHCIPWQRPRSFACIPARPGRKAKSGPCEHSTEIPEFPNSFGRPKEGAFSTFEGVSGESRGQGKEAKVCLACPILSPCKPHSQCVRFAPERCKLRSMSKGIDPSCKQASPFPKSVEIRHDGKLQRCIVCLDTFNWTIKTMTVRIQAASRRVSSLMSSLHWLTSNAQIANHRQNCTKWRLLLYFRAFDMLYDP